MSLGWLGIFFVAWSGMMLYVHPAPRPSLGKFVLLFMVLATIAMFVFSHG